MVTTTIQESTNTSKEKLAQNAKNFLDQQKNEIKLLLSEDLMLQPTIVPELKETEEKLSNFSQRIKHYQEATELVIENMQRELAQQTTVSMKRIIEDLGFIKEDSPHYTGAVNSILQRLERSDGNRKGKKINLEQKIPILEAKLEHYEKLKKEIEDYLTPFNGLIDIVEKKINLDEIETLEYEYDHNQVIHISDLVNKEQTPHVTNRTNKNHEPLNGGPRTTKVQNKDGEEILVEIIIPANTGPQRDALNMDQVQILYSGTTTPLDIDEFPIEFNLFLKTKRYTQPQIGINPSFPSPIFMHKKVPIRLTRESLEEYQKRTILTDLLEENAYQRTKDIIRNVYQPSFGHLQPRETIIEKKIEELTANHDPLWGEFFNQNKQACLASLADHCQGMFRTPNAANPQTSNTHRQQLLITNDPIHQVNAISHSFIDFFSQEDIKLPGDGAGHGNFIQTAKHYLTHLEANPHTDPLRSLYTQSDNFRESVVTSRYHLRDRHSLSSGDERQNLGQTYETYKTDRERLYTTIPDYRSAFEEFREDRLYKTYMYNGLQTEPVTKDIKTRDHDTLTLSINLSSDGQHYGCDIQITNKKTKEVLRPSGDDVIDEQKGLTGITDIYTYIHNVCHHFDSTQLQEHKGLLHNAFSILLLRQLAKDRIADKDYARFDDGGDTRGSIAVSDNGESQLSVIGKHNTISTRFEEQNGNHPNLNDINFACQAIHLSFVNKYVTDSEAIDGKIHADPLQAKEPLKIGLGTLSINPIFARYDRLPKQEPIKIGEHLRLIPTSKSRTLLQGTPPDQQILTKSKGRQQYDTRSQDEKLSDITAKREGLIDEGIDASYEGGKILKERSHFLLKENRDIIKGLAQSAFINPAVSLWQSLKRIGTGFNKKQKQKMLDSYKDRGTNTKGFLIANREQMKSIFNIPLLTGKRGYKAGKLGYKHAKISTQYLRQGTKPLIDPHYKKTHNASFILDNIQSELLSPELQNRNTLLQHIYRQQFEQKMKVWDNYLRRKQGRPPDAKKDVKNRLFKKRNETSETQSSGLNESVNIYKKLGKGFFVRHPLPHGNIYCIVQAPMHEGKRGLIACELKTRRLTTTFEQQIGRNKIVDNEDDSLGTKARSHQERLFHEYDSGAVNGDMIRDWIAYTATDKANGPIRHRCEIPETGKPWSNGHMAMMFEDPTVWGKFTKIIDTGQGTRIAPIGQTTPIHDPAALDQDVTPPNISPDDIDVTPPDIHEQTLATPSFDIQRQDVQNDTNFDVSPQVVSRPTAQIDPEVIDIDNVRDYSGFNETTESDETTETLNLDYLEVIIICDGSTSMGGNNKVQQQREACINTLKTLHNPATSKEFAKEIKTKVVMFRRQDIVLKDFDDALDENKLSQELMQLDGGESGGTALGSIYDDLNTRTDGLREEIQKDKPQKKQVVLFMGDSDQFNGRSELDSLRGSGVPVFGIGIGARTIEDAFGTDTTDPLGRGKNYQGNELDKIGEGLHDAIVKSTSTIVPAFRTFEQTLGNGNILTITEDFNQDSDQTSITQEERTPAPSNKLQHKIVEKRQGRGSDGNILSQETVDTRTDNHVHQKRTYDPSTGNTISEEEIHRQGGTTHRQISQNYDPTTTDITSLGNFDNTTEHIQVVDPATQRRHRKQTLAGVSTERTETTSGNTVTLDHTSNDTNTNTQVHHIVVRENGRVKSETREETVNGVTQNSVSQEYDAAGTAIKINNTQTDPEEIELIDPATGRRYRKQTTANGSTERNEITSGNTVTLTHTTLDTTTNTETISTVTTEDGTLVQETRETQVNGVTQNRVSQTYDPNTGALLTLDNQNLETGDVERIDATGRRYKQQTTANGNITREQTVNAAGQNTTTQTTIDNTTNTQTVTSVTTEDGNVVMQTLEETINGEIQRRVSQGYDPNTGELTSLDHENTSAGIVEHIDPFLNQRFQMQATDTNSHEQDEVANGDRTTVSNIDRDHTSNTETTTTVTTENGNRVQETLERKVNDAVQLSVKQGYNETDGQLNTRERNETESITINGTPGVKETKHTFYPQNRSTLIVETIKQGGANIAIGNLTLNHDAQDMNNISIGTYNVTGIGGVQIMSCGFVPNSQRIQSFTINDYLVDSGLRMPSTDELISAVGGDAQTKTEIRNMLNGGDIKHLRIDDTGKVRRLGVENNTAQISMEHLPFVDEIRIDVNQCPMELFSEDTGDHFVIYPHDLKPDGMFDISSLQDELYDQVVYSNATLEIPSP